MYVYNIYIECHVSRVWIDITIFLVKKASFFFDKISENASFSRYSLKKKCQFNAFAVP